MKKIFSLILSLLVLTSICYADEIELTPKEEIIKQIISKGYDYNSKGLFEAIKDGDSICVSKFLNTGTDPNSTYMKLPAILWAINYKQPKIVEQLVKAGANPNEDFGGVTPLFYAIRVKHEETVTTLIRLGANINQKVCGTSPLEYALKKKNHDASKALIYAGASVDEKSLAKALKSKNDETKNLVLTKYKKQ